MKQLDFLCIPCVVTYQAHLGGFRHLADVNPRNLRQVGINNYILQTLGIFAFGTGKVSVGCLILRLLPPSSVWRKWFIWSTIVFVFLFDSVNCVITFVQCSPPRALWDPQIPHTCWDPKVQTNIAFGGTGQYIKFAERPRILILCSIQHIRGRCICITADDYYMEIEHEPKKANRAMCYSRSRSLVSTPSKLST